MKETRFEKSPTSLFLRKLPFPKQLARAPPGQKQGAKGIDYVAVYSFVDLLSRIAILLVLFLMGLDTNIREIKRLRQAAVSVAVLGVIAPLLLGLATMKFLHPDSAGWGSLSSDVGR